MAYIGMKRPVYAPITTYTAGSAITYGTGAVLAHAVAATLTQNRRDNPLWADDIKVENDKGMTDYTIDIEVDDIPLAARAAMLGEVQAGTSSAQYYAVKDVDVPYVGFGYIRVHKVNNVRKYEAFWFHRVQFAVTTEEASTKTEQINWGTMKLTGTGTGVVLDNSGTEQFYDHMEFSSESAAVTWLNSRAHIS